MYELVTDYTVKNSQDDGQRLQNGNSPQHAQVLRLCRETVTTTHR